MMMKSIFDVFPFLARVLSAPLSWFRQLTDAIPGSVDLIIIGFFITVVIGLFVIPLRGSYMSDKVRGIVHGKSGGNKGKKSGDA